MSDFIDWLTDLFFDEPIQIEKKSSDPMDERACYHALKRRDCWYFQQRKCRCEYPT